MHQEKYSLAWQTYSDHLKSMMKELMMNDEFSDVTLVTEDNKQMKANINILSACSPVFKDILKKQKNSSPIMYLRGIQFSEMESILQFIYLGEATFYEERMDEFLAVAKSLEIKEICNAETGENNVQDDETSSSSKVLTELLTQDYDNKLFLQNILTNNRLQISSSNDETSSGDSVTENSKEQTCKSDQFTEQAPQEARRQKVVRVHGQYECETCQKTFTTSQGLNFHTEAVHQGVKYACPECDHQATHQHHLTVHIQAKHEGVKYVCDQCEQQFKHKKALKVHTQSKHEGITYACDQCGHQVTTQANLIRHIQSKHKGIKYACPHCNYKATQKNNLGTHIKTKHN